MKAFLLSITALVHLLAPALSTRAQTASPPVLTIDDAVALAMKGNRQVQSSALDVARAHEGEAAVKTQLFPQVSLYILGGETLSPIDFTIPRGVLGVYPGTGPIPGQTSKISTPQSFNEFLVGQAAQPISPALAVPAHALSCGRAGCGRGDR